MGSNPGSSALNEAHGLNLGWGGFNYGIPRYHNNLHRTCNGLVCDTKQTGDNIGSRSVGTVCLYNWILFSRQIF